MTKGQKIISEWFLQKQWEQFPFQKDMESAYLAGHSGLLNAPTGSGKTFAMFLPFVADYIDKHPNDYQLKKSDGLLMLWITPLRALTNDIRKAMQTLVDDLGLPWQVLTRTGDTPAKEKQDLKKKQPQVLLTTPESLHLMLAQKDYAKFFENLQVVVADEWHELLGTKRGVQLELGLSKLKSLKSDTGRLKQENENFNAKNLRSELGHSSSELIPQNSNLRIWGISATIGNLDQAAEVLLGNNIPKENIRLIKSKLDKKIVIESVIPENIEKFSWAGHLGIKLLPQVIEIVEKSNTTLIFTNTRSQSEIWYMTILEKYPEYAGIMAMHHGSLDNELRKWVEEALHNELLKIVVCTSSLDLGVDFRPVDTVIQIGSPKGVARFMQRAGRSGHHPGAVSKAYFVPTHSMELLEGAALKDALKLGIYESRDPIILAMDVLVQYMVTLAVSDGFRPNELYDELKTTYAYADLTREDFGQMLEFITQGGKTLSAYDEFLKVEIENGLYKVNNRRVAMRHRLSMGTIVSDVSMRVKFLTGGYLGSLEEYFISKLKIGDTFWFAGRSLELVKIKDMTAVVRKSSKLKGIIPSWMGGRMPLSSQLAALFRNKLDQVHHYQSERLQPYLKITEKSNTALKKDGADGFIAADNKHLDIEVLELMPLFDLQAELSHLPSKKEFLIEKFVSRDGHHTLFYPFEGRLVHEGMGSLLAFRISKIKNASFSIAMNDYGFELLTDEELPLEEALKNDLFSIDNLLDDIQQSLNATEMARRRFRDIAHIAGLIFTGFPGKGMKTKHLQASTSLLFEVFSEYEKDNVLVRQAYHEALQFQLEEYRLRAALQRIQKLKVVIKTCERPTPFAFPIIVDGLSREKLTTETLEERVAKMTARYEKS